MYRWGRVVPAAICEARVPLHGLRVKQVGRAGRVVGWDLGWANAWAEDGYGRDQHQLRYLAIVVLWGSGGIGLLHTST